MSSDKPVIVYGASGYTGRLVCEYLREFNLPFVAAGRDKARIQDGPGRVPGIDTVEHEILEVAHEVGPLTELFGGASVVCNTVGPFTQYGGEVVQACLAAGCHYLDTTGEQDWLIDCDEQYGRRWRTRACCSPRASRRCTPPVRSRPASAETPGLDTLDILVFWKGMPTIASTRTILVNACLSKAYYLEQNTVRRMARRRRLYDVIVPGQHETGLALPWGGTSHPGVVQARPARGQREGARGRLQPGADAGRAADRDGSARSDRGPAREREAPGAHRAGRDVMNQMPPREATRINTSLDSVQRPGPLGRAHCVIHGNSNYKQTGLMQAYGAYSLLQQPPKRVGFASGCQAFGHRELLGVLRTFGLVMEPDPHQCRAERARARAR